MGSTFNRFGILNVLKCADGGGELWMDDIKVGGSMDRFDADPEWDQLNNRRTYETRNSCPAFDFGFSRMQLRHGIAPGEFGGLLFRGHSSCYPQRMAYYGGVTEALTLDDPLLASGKLCLVAASPTAPCCLAFSCDQSM